MENRLVLNGTAKSCLQWDKTSQRVFCAVSLLNSQNTFRLWIQQPQNLKRHDETLPSPKAVGAISQDIWRLPPLLWKWNQLSTSYVRTSEIKYWFDSNNRPNTLQTHTHRYTGCSPFAFTLSNVLRWQWRQCEKMKLFPSLAAIT